VTALHAFSRYSRYSAAILFALAIATRMPFFSLGALTCALALGLIWRM
jgi:hypothetical protein